MQCKLSMKNGNDYCQKLKQTLVASDIISCTQKCYVALINNSPMTRCCQNQVIGLFCDYSPTVLIMLLYIISIIGPR